jgi:hypothetical protein
MIETVAKSLLSILFVAVTFGCELYAYDESVVHPQMTRAAFQDALGRHDFLARLNIRPNAILDAPENEFGLVAAKQHLRRAIVATDLELRNQAAADLFVSLGHIMHLVEDMAQPQHTRNDFHLTLEGTSVETLTFLYSGTWSRYEKWCEQNLSNKIIASYGPVELNFYEDFFKSYDGRGLAEYSNRNFVTEHTNYSDSPCPPFDHAIPMLANGTPRQETHVVTVTSWDESAATDTITTAEYDDVVFSFPTYDSLTGTSTVNPNHTFYSYFDYELKQATGERAYSLPESAFASQAALLVPRAVGYASGILQHFFRGEVSAEWKERGAGTYDLVLHNLSNAPFEGKVEAYYRVVPGTHGAAASEDLVAIDPTTLGNAIVAMGAKGSVTSTATISNVVAAGLASNETVNTFERRLLLTGNLGGESGAEIALVQTPDEADLVITAKFASGGADPGLYIVDASDAGTIERSVPRAANSQEFRIHMQPGHDYRALIFRTETQSAAVIDINVRVHGVDTLTKQLSLGGNDVAAFGCYTNTPPATHVICDNYIIRNFYDCTPGEACFVVQYW